MWNFEFYMFQCYYFRALFGCFADNWIGKNITYLISL